MNDPLPWKPFVSSPWIAIFSEGGRPIWAIKGWCIAPFPSSPPPEVGTEIKPFIFIFSQEFSSLNECFYEKRGKKGVKMGYGKRLEKILKGPSVKGWHRARGESKPRVGSCEPEEGWAPAFRAHPSSFVTFLRPSLLLSSPVLLCFWLCPSELTRTRKALCLSSQILFEWWNNIRSMHNCSALFKKHFLEGSFTLYPFQLLMCV